MSNEPREYLKHIAEECSYILSVSRGLSKETFFRDETLKRAIVRSLEIIGEASKRIPTDFRGEIQFSSMEEHGGHEID